MIGSTSLTRKIGTSWYQVGTVNSESGTNVRVLSFATPLDSCLTAFQKISRSTGAWRFTL